jgi:hypothetical protein
VTALPQWLGPSGWFAGVRAELAAARDELPEITDYSKRVSDQLVRLVQVFFGVVAGQGLVLYRDVVMSPFHHGNAVAALALVSIYMMIIWSWIDWNTTMERAPYDLRRVESPERAARVLEHAERWRLYCDIAIVATYAYTLFWVEPLKGHPGADIRYLLLGYVVVFVLYLVSGVLRIIRYGSKASSLPPILIFLGAFIALFGLYVLLTGTSGVVHATLNCFWLLIGWGGMYAYRWYRSFWRRRHPA